MKIAGVLVVVLIPMFVFGQKVDSLNYHTEPKGGMAALAITYFKIDFTKEEIDYLRTHEAELIFMVNEDGRAKLEKVNNIGIPSIIDSMKRADHRLPEFYQEVVDGIPQRALFFITIRWPHYEMETQFRPYPIHRRKLDQFEFIEYYGPRLDLMLGGIANTPSGSTSRYNRNGGGMKMDIMVFGKKLGGGMVMVVHDNRMTENYPITTPIPQNPHRMTLFIGGAIGKVLKESPQGNHFIVQLEPCILIQNIVTIDQQIKNKPVQSRGFSPGLIVNYNLSLGTGKMSGHYLSPIAVRHYLNFNIGVRPMFTDRSFTAGAMFEAGVGYRLMEKHVHDYKIKD